MASSGAAALFRTLFASVADAMLVTDAALRIVAVNPAFTAAVDRPEAELAGEPLSVLLRRESDVQRVAEAAGTLAPSASVDVPVGLRCPSPRVLAGRLRLARPAHGEHLVVTFLEGTPSQKPGGLQAGTERRWPRLAGAGFEGLIISENGVILDANIQAAAIFGHEPDEIVGRSTTEFVTPEYRQVVADATRRKDPGPYQVEGLRKDGSCFWVELRARTFEDGGRSFRVTAAYDITERRMVEQALVESEERYRKTFESLHDVFFQTDLEGRFVLVSPSVMVRTGYTPDELIGRTADVFLVEPSDWEALTATLERDGVILDFEARFRRFDGSLAWASITASPTRSPTGERVGYQGTLRDVSSRKEAEDALRQSEQRWRGVLDSLHDIYFEATLDDILTFQSPAARRIYGAHASDMIGKHTRDLYVDPGRHAELVSVLRAGHDVEDFEAEFHAASGTVHVSINCKLVFGPDGVPIGTQGTVRDITARKQGEEALRASEARLRRLIETSAEGICTTDADTRITFANGAMSRMMGYSADELSGMRTEEILAPQSREARDAAVARILITGHERFDAEYIRKDGTGLWTSVNLAVVSQKGEPFSALAMFTDISERRRAEEALRESEQRYRRILETAIEGICMIAPDGGITFVNRSLAEMFGYGMNEMIGEQTERFIAPGWLDSETRVRTEGWRAGNTERFECQYVRKDGSLMWGMVSISPIEQGEGKFAALAMITDITERRRTEERLALHIRHTPLAVIQWDTAFSVAGWNPAAERMFGWSEADAQGRHATDLMLSSESRDEADAAWEAMLASPEPACTVRENVTKDGRRIIVEWFNTPLVDDTGKVIGVASLAEDITETRRITEERDSILDLSLDMMAVVASTGEIKRVNPAWGRTLGYRDDPLLGANVFLFIHRNDRGHAIRESQRTEKGEAVIDLRTRMICADGSYRWLSWNITPVQNGLAYTVGRDITAQVEAEEEQATLLQALAENTRVLEEQAMEMDRLRIAAEHLASYDMLTSVCNRRAWFAAAEEGKHSAVAIFDVDHFKRINDSFGHPAGDSVLQAVAARLAAAVEPYAILGRVGGEEFAAVFHVPFHEARAACERAVEAIASEPIGLPSAGRLDVTISGGLAPWRAGRVSVSDALQATYEEADVALYQAKEAGRRRLVVRGPRAA